MESVKGERGVEARGRAEKVQCKGITQRDSVRESVKGQRKRIGLSIS